MNKDPDQLETLDTVAAECAISYETARALTKCGKLPFVDVGTGKDKILRRVRRADLDAFKRASRRENVDQQFATARAIAAASSRPGYI